MFLVDWTGSTPAENLACDEALLDLGEDTEGLEFLRFWIPNSYWVAVGYGNRVSQEVNVEACEAAQIPIYRRCSGGGTVLQGPGCLNFSLVVRIDDEMFHSIASTNAFIMRRHAEALQRFAPLKVQGISDLTLEDRKVSGNAQRRKRHCLLYHGTFLLSFDLPRISEFLRCPSRQPDYRRGRTHDEFLTNLGADPEEIKRSIAACWGARESYPAPPMAAIKKLVRQKYATPAWNLKF